MDWAWTLTDKFIQPKLWVGRRFFCRHEILAVRAASLVSILEGRQEQAGARDELQGICANVGLGRDAEKEGQLLPLPHQAG